MSQEPHGRSVLRLPRDIGPVSCLPESSMSIKILLGVLYRYHGIWFRSGSRGWSVSPESLWEGIVKCLNDHERPCACRTLLVSPD